MSRQYHLLTSRDGCVRFLADRSLRRELRRKFRPAAAARDVLEVSPGGSQKALTKAAKAIVVDDANTSLLDHMQSLERQRHMSRCTDPKCALVWSTVVQSLPEEQMKFSLLMYYHTIQICTCGRRGKILPAHSVTTTNPSCTC